MRKNEKGFSAVEILVVVVIVGLLGTVGWVVYNRQKSRTDNNLGHTQANQQEKKEPITPKEKAAAKVPESWVKYQDTASGVSFYYPSEWDKNKLQVYKTSVSKTIKGTNFGPYSAKYKFNKAENKWYAIDFEGNQVAPYSGYTTITTIPVSNYPAVYGSAGEGAGVSYYAVFTDGTSSYMIELPVIDEESDSTGLSKQKQAIVDLVKTIKIN